jgi:hypothetical protein
MSASASLPSGWSEKVALLFYLALLDESIASRLTTRCVSDIRSLFFRQLKSSPQLAESDLLEQIIVKSSAKLLQGRKKSRQEDADARAKAAKWQIPKQVDLGPWRQFQKEGDWNEITAVIWNQILEFKTENIALGLEVTTGTVRYRAGHGLRQLAPLTMTGSLYA